MMANCPHCMHPLTDAEVFDLVNKATFQKVRECEHVPHPDPEDPSRLACVKCGVNLKMVTT